MLKSWICGDFLPLLPCISICQTSCHPSMETSSYSFPRKAGRKEQLMMWTSSQDLRSMTVPDSLWLIFMVPMFPTRISQSCISIHIECFPWEQRCDGCHIWCLYRDGEQRHRHEDHWIYPDGYWIVVWVRLSLESISAFSVKTLFYQFAFAKGMIFCTYNYVLVQ